MKEEKMRHVELWEAASIVGPWGERNMHKKIDMLKCLFPLDSWKTDSSSPFLNVILYIYQIPILRYLCEHYIILVLWKLPTLQVKNRDTPFLHPFQLTL